MSSTSTAKNLGELKRDLSLRGYTEKEILELLQIPILIIPGNVTPISSDEPGQKLTKHQVDFSKDLHQEGINNQVVLRKNVERRYIEERSAHVDLGTIVVSLVTLQTLGGIANVAQVLDFVLNWIQFKLSRGRTENLTPDVKFSLRIHDNQNEVYVNYEGPVTGMAQVEKMTKPSRIQAALQNISEDNE